MHKSLIGLAAAAAVGLATVAGPVPANAYCVGCAVGAGVLGGVVAGAIIGSAIANSPPPPPPPGYYPPPPAAYYPPPPRRPRLRRARARLLLGKAQGLDRRRRLPLADRAGLSVTGLSVTDLSVTGLPRSRTGALNSAGRLEIAGRFFVAR